jgi:glutamate-1-semialdehyde 2,1-aminomutase
MSQRYAKSESLLERALQSIPLGTQTFSKSRTQFPFGVSPYFIQKAKGSRAWDVDGNEYLDMISSLCAINLGYNDPDVTRAVRAQMEEGVIFSLAHPIEAQVAEKIVEMVPCAEKVRFGKNGSDATSGAVRLSRAYTGRDRVAVCGYHGWQDWYIGSTARNRGVPQAVRDLTHPFLYNQLETLDALLQKHPGEFAAVILEPMNTTDPKPGFLQGVRDLATKHGAVLIFDETITGFRFANGGAQELFGVTPDLATFGKGLANGYPVSAIAGKSEIMKLMEEIFFSFTFGGEALSLAAALATLTKLQTEPVLETVRKRGTWLLDRLRPLVTRHGLDGVFTVSGHPAWSFLQFGDAVPGPTVAVATSLWEIKTYFMQECLERGVLTYGTHNLSYAHTEADLQRLLDVYGEVFAGLAKHLQAGDLRKQLKCEPIQPLFKLR